MGRAQGAGGMGQVTHGQEGITSICQLVGNFEAVHSGRRGHPADLG